MDEGEVGGGSLAFFSFFFFLYIEQNTSIMASYIYYGFLPFCIFSCWLKSV
jgi:hypothetical protein